MAIAVQKRNYTASFLKHYFRHRYIISFVASVQDAEVI